MRGRGDESVILRAQAKALCGGACSAAAALPRAVYKVLSTKEVTSQPQVPIRPSDAAGISPPEGGFRSVIDFYDRLSRSTFTIDIQVVNSKAKTYKVSVHTTYV